MRVGALLAGAVLVNALADGNLFAQPTGVLEKLEQDISYIVEKVKPCVVTVSGRGRQVRYTPGPRRKGFLSLFRRDRIEQRGDTSGVVQVCRVGSGLIYDSLGHVITRSSVVLDAGEIWVTFIDGRKYRAEYVGCDVQTGIAVVRVRADSLVPAVFSDGSVRPGAWVTIVGNSLGVTPSVSVGLVNAVRPDGLIQLSANLNPGLTGSPAFDSQGRVAGILIASLGSATDAAGAVAEALSGTALLCPAQIVRSAVESILARSVRPRGWVGVTVEREERPVRGVRVIQVVRNSPADLAGIRPGDLIVRVGPKRTQTIAELLQHLTEAEPGEVLDFTILRGRRTIRALVEVVERPARGDFHVEVESGCGTVIPSERIAPAAYGYRSPAAPRGSRDDLERRIRRLEREIQMLKSRMR